MRTPSAPQFRTEIGVEIWFPRPRFGVVRQRTEVTQIGSTADGEGRVCEELGSQNWRRLARRAISDAPQFHRRVSRAVLASRSHNIAISCPLTSHQHTVTTPSCCCCCRWWWWCVLCMMTYSRDSFSLLPQPIPVHASVATIPHLHAERRQLSPTASISR